MSWTPLVSFFVLILIFCIGEEISAKTRSVLSLVLVSALLHLLGYWTGLIPVDSVVNTGMPGMLASFGLAIMVTNLGTMIDLNQLLGEWKVVLICFFALFGLAVGCFTVGSAIFGREYALVAAAPIAGGNVACTIVGEACENAGRSDLAGYAAIITTLQCLVGLPAVAVLLNRQLKFMQTRGMLKSREALLSMVPGEKTLPQIGRHSFKNMPKWWTRPYPMLARLALIAILSQFVSNVTGIPTAICWLVLGILCYQVGFLEKTTLQAGGFYPFFLLLQLSNIPKLLAGVTWDAFKGMIIPVVGMLLLGGLSLAVFGMIAGKVLRVPVRIAASTALCAMLGYPYTLLMTEDAVGAMEGSDAEKELAKGYILPKMLVAGFITVTLASVAFADIITPMIF